MSIRFDDKVAIVTGAGGGLGRSHALDLASRGAKVVVNDLGGSVDGASKGSSSAAEKVVEEIKAAGGEAIANGASVTDIDQVKEMVQQTIEAYGRIDILINNAGAIPSGSIYAVSEEAWRKGWELKVFGYIEMTRAYYTIFRERGFGVILNDIGNSGENPDFDYVAGSTGNSALMTFTKAIGGTSLDYGVRVLAVNPGPVDTGRMEKMLRQRAGVILNDEGRWEELLGRFPGGRASTPEEIANAIAFLSSPAASYINGCVVTIDGGISARGSVV